MALFACDDAADNGVDAAAGAGGGIGGEGGQGGIGGEGGQGGQGGNPTDGGMRDVFVGAPQCSDGADNDGDGLIDLADPGCEDALDNDERQRQCADGIDNDEDGLIDFPADPGCGSANDNDEYNEPVLPECADGIDNDRNGYIDEQDPGCSAVADNDESPPDHVAQCSDRIDNDDDGVIDFPLEPGCTAAGDDDETNPPSPTACANGRDDDGDDLIDYPDDPGCFGVGDRDEADKPVTPECADGQDNDRDGRIDFPADDGCIAASDASEKGTCLDRYDPPRATNGMPLVLDTSNGIFSSAGSCGGQGSPESVVAYRVTDTIEALEVTTIGERTRVPTTLYVRRTDCLVPAAEVGCATEPPAPETPGHTLRIEAPPRGEYFIFVDGVAGAGGSVELTVNEVPLAECLNGLDDDEDGVLDYPDDPGCVTPDDRDETTVDFAACSNDADDDEDGLTDYPQDTGCVSAAWDDETDVCGQGVHFQEYFFGQPFVFGNTDEREGGTNALAGRCAGRNAPEVAYVYRNPYNARLVISTAHAETEVGTAVYLRSACAEQNTELACDDGSAGGASNGRITVNMLPPGTYYIIVDTKLGIGGRFKLSIESVRDDPECDDGADNDRDGFIDLEDPGCGGPSDDSERDPARPAACNNGVDDDGDNRIDYPLDPGCVARGDNDEADPAVPPACLNGVDD
ncbi:MAG: hypothetical protein KC620_08960, partial [Myxococcales bacterium]|nr:hypothetical protein [Myxococcales bacterium]